MATKTVYIQDENGNTSDELLLTSVPAKGEDVERVLNAEVGNDGRSEFRWFRLQNGDLILGVYPQGDTYEDISFNCGV